MISNAIIRPATAEDDLSGLWRKVYEADHRPLLPSGADVPFEPRGDAFAAFVEGDIAGFCYVDRDWLDEVWVAKEWQGRGIGTALIRYAEDKMRCGGVGEASLSVFSGNTRAIGLYRRLGWAEFRSFTSSANGLVFLRMADGVFQSKPFRMFAMTSHEN
jgi:ribosomal-protein-alanine N-acetyltransferase